MDNQRDRDQFECVVRLLARELSKSGLNVAQSEIRAADGDEKNGWYVTLGNWSIGRPEIQVWFDHWLEKSRRHFWFGFGGHRREVKKLLGDLAFKEPPAEYNNSRFEHDRGSSTVIAQRHGGLVYERYRGDASYLGKYDIGFKESLPAEMLVNEAAIFVLESIDKADQVDAKRNGATEYEANVLGRIGQREFRRKLERRWGNKCAVTKCGIPEALRASHIKSWRSSDGRERLDANNGLLLVATIDALFDKHLISFDDEGRIVFAKVTPEERRLLTLDGLKLVQPPSQQQIAYLKIHRAEAEHHWNCKLTAV